VNLLRKRELLFVLDSLSIGGAEKSLISLLSSIDASKYKIDLLLFRKGEDLEKYIPDYINVLQVPEYYRFVYGKKFTVTKNIKYQYFKLKTSLGLRLNNYSKKNLHSEQVVYKCVSKAITALEKKYDVAIAYSQGMPTYFVANKVTASKKLAWINTDYVNTLYDKEIDYESYSRINKIVAVSQHTKESISKLRNEYNDKVDIVLDIINPHLIVKMSEEEQVKEFDDSLVNILTVGRLVTAKSYETAIEVAKLLRDSGYKFKWFAIGEGSEREKLEELIRKYDLKGSFILLGKRVNPYPYMKHCNIYVQTSIKEGFGLTVSEAKILKKPIVCTDFPTAKEIINSDIDGLIVKHDVNSIFNGIRRYLDEPIFNEKIRVQLNTIEPYNSVNQLEKFYQLVEN
jgi:glycosyltransferase involved in cell wall biosynthesis